VLLIKRKRGVERTASDQIAGSSAVEARVKSCVVFLRRRGRELDLDVGIVFLKAGMIFEFQMSASSLRQLSIFSEPA